MVSQWTSKISRKYLLFCVYRISIFKLRQYSKSTTVAPRTLKSKAENATYEQRRI